LAQWQPKSAQRAVPTGSVYWLEDIEADEAALRRLIANGLWQTPAENAARRAEGFNRCVLAI
jgi:CRISPR-associated protein Cmr3